MDYLANLSTVHFNQNLKRHISRNSTDATDLHASTVFNRINFSLSDKILMDMMQFVFLCIIGLASLSDVGASPVNGKLKKTSGYLLYSVFQNVPNCDFFSIFMVKGDDSL